jgi:ribonuclease-3
MSFLNISLLEDALEHRFQQRALLEQALTHSSYAREMESQATPGSVLTGEHDNEQMEFLGDAVLSFVVSQELFRRFPQYTEGELSKLRAHIVSARHLLRPARKLDIGQYLRLGRGEDKSGGRGKSALLVDALEAIIAALFLDAGLAAAQQFILEKILEPELADLQSHAGEKFPVTDYKSALQEAVHAVGRPQPRYILVKEEGPEHRKLFTMEAHIAASSNGDAEFVSRGEGNTKKLAEQGAARRAWEYLQSLRKAPGEDSSLPAGESSEHP